MGVLTGWSEPLAHWVEVVKPAFLLNSDYDIFDWGLLQWGESVQWQPPAWRGVTPSPNQGADSEASSP